MASWQCDKTFQCRTPEEVPVLAALIAGYFPDPKRAMPGIVELLMNAIEHGNLGLDFNTKRELLLNGGWGQEIQRRLKMPVHKDRQVKVRLVRDTHHVRLEVMDEGNGFDWKTFLTRKALDAGPNGRGLMLARKLSFDDLEFSDKGNNVMATVIL